MDLPGSVREWRQSGRLVEVGQGRVFVRASPGEGRPVLLLHGYPSSGFDFRHLTGLLAGRPTLTVDFLGFGLSDKPRPHDYSIFEHADHVEQVLAAEGTREVDVVAHDMGTSVATELMARDRDGNLPFTLGTVVLTNGGMIVERASLRPIQHALLSPAGWLVSRLANRPVFTRQFGQLFSARHPLSREEAAAQWALITQQGGHRIAHLLCRYVRERVVHADRWHGAIRHWPGSLAFVWGLQDPVATPYVLEGLRELRPAAPVTELPDLAHYPQLEDPTALADAVLAHLGG